MKAHFEELAAYNAWANRRLYDAAEALDDDLLHQDCQVAFGSLHGTLNHMFVADVIWMSRFRGQPNPPWALDHIAHDDMGDLRARREALDRDIEGFVASLREERLSSELTYMALTQPEKVSQGFAGALTHFFNHQTHHRGQCHAMLTRLAGAAPSLDLVYFQRGL